LLASEHLHSRPDAEENLRALERMLMRSEDFLIAFARVNVPSQRVELVKQLRDRLEAKGITLIEIDLREPIRDLFGEVQRALAAQYLPSLNMPKVQANRVRDAARYAIFVYGLEHSLPSSEIYHPALAVMNYKRENFRDALHTPLVLWVPEFALQAIIEGAPDFWAWRSGVFEFASPRETAETTWRAIEPERGQIELSRLTLEEKRQRIQILSGLLAEYEDRADKDEPELAAIRMDLLNRIGMVNNFIGEYTLALDFYQRGLYIAQQKDAQAEIANFSHNIGMIHQDRGDYASALAQYEKSLKILEELGDRAGVASSLHQIGNLHYLRGDYDAALAQYEKSLKIFEELGNRAGMASSLHQIGRIHEDRGDYDAALAQYEKSLQIAEGLGNRAGVAISLHQIGMIHQKRGDYATALVQYEKSRKILEEIGDRANVARSLHQIGIINQERGDYAAALAQYEKSLKIKEELGDRAGVAHSRGQIGNLFTQTGRYAEAFEHLLFALATFAELQSPNAGIAANMLKDLRTQWGEANFDSAWQQATGTQAPEGLFEA
jgi:tetratricopeptide (TPR) repeat protein